MDKKRSSEQIAGELQTLRAKIRDLEAQKAEHVKALERAKTERKRSAYSAHSDKDAKAQERLAKARAAQRESELALEDLESAISEGRARFEALEREWKKTLAAEAWAALMVEVDTARKEAGLIDQARAALVTLMGPHGKRLEHIKNTAHNLGFERAFATVGLRHADRVFAWKMIQEGFAAEFEKPSEQYRKASGYADILAEQIEAAVSAHDRAMKEHEAEQADTGANAEMGATG